MILNPVPLKIVSGGQTGADRAGLAGGRHCTGDISGVAGGKPDRGAEYRRPPREQAAWCLCGGLPTLGNFAATSAVKFSAQRQCRLSLFLFAWLHHPNGYRCSTVNPGERGKAQQANCFVDVKPPATGSVDP